MSFSFFGSRRQRDRSPSPVLFYPLLLKPVQLVLRWMSFPLRSTKERVILFYSLFFLFISFFLFLASSSSFIVLVSIRWLEPRNCSEKGKKRMNGWIISYTWMARRKRELDQKEQTKDRIRQRCSIGQFDKDRLDTHILFGKSKELELFVASRIWTFFAFSIFFPSVFAICFSQNNGIPKVSRPPNYHLTLSPSLCWTFWTCSKLSFSPPNWWGVVFSVMSSSSSFLFRHLFFSPFMSSNLIALQCCIQCSEFCILSLVIC